MKRNGYTGVVAALFYGLAIAFILHSCGTSRKLQTLESKQTMTEIDFVKPSEQKSGVDTEPQKVEEEKPQDTIVIHENGKDYLVMTAIKDEEGDMVAMETLDAAVVSARFKNVLEEEGSFVVDFNVTVPKEMLDKDWKLSFVPRFQTGTDTLKLDQLSIVGYGYRERQLRGYDLYDRYVSRINEDNVDTLNVFVHKNLLEKFIQRNIPQMWALRSDSTYVSDKDFESVFGVTDRLAMEHYMRHHKIARNNRLRSNSKAVFHSYVKDPIVSEGVYLDTVITNFDSSRVYRYTKKVDLPFNVKKAELVLGGLIYSYGQKLYDIRDSKPLTIYFNSLTDFVDTSLHYKKKVISRNLDINASTRVEFAIGRSDIDLALGNNHAELDSMWALINRVFSMEGFEADSVIVTVNNSPDGSYATNERLANQRRISFANYFNSGLDTLKGSTMFASVNDEGSEVWYGGKKDFPVITRTVVEDWKGFETLVKTDTVLTDNQKADILGTLKTKSLDARESALRRMNSYNYLKDSIFSRLRKVDLQFSLHRRGMLKDTIHTDVVDDAYMAAVAALKNYKYAESLTIFSEHNDYNAAVAYLNLHYNNRAINILEGCPKSANRDYLLAIAYAREKRETDAVMSLKRAILANPQFRFRANLDKELSGLVEKYNFDY